MRKTRVNPTSRIGIDLMGSDASPHDLFQVVFKHASTSPIHLEVYALPSIFEKLTSHPNISFITAQEIISMEDDPLLAIRQKKGASLVIGIKRLKKKAIQGFVTAGNTGALIAAAAHFLTKQPGIRRPALLATLPTEKTPLVIVDVGGNVSCRAEHLLQFAKMGVAYQKSTFGCALPRVGLLNVGVEPYKGHRELRLAWKLLNESQTDFQFIGNVEARDLFLGHLDVLVTDGFTGNILIKTMEGLSQHLLKAFHIQNPNLKSFDYVEHPGALICGVEGTIIKCHGIASKEAFSSSLTACIRAISAN